ncbi:MAG: hypothetical protein JXX29_12645 [Deltaproteobacteria bacterium]|nr:hypothetical protein [Deltaproteobacteria bacterium]MBN2672524.1 hypothetical protein [Deltaproteobacteria bacterium]
MKLRAFKIFAVAAFSLWLAAPTVSAQEATDQVTNNSLILGFKVSAGGRYDDVRMCVATPAGTKGGPALDISFFTEIGLKEDVSLLVNIPVMRPLLFAGAFKMLQFEPEVSLLFRHVNDGKVDVVAGPTLGMVFHYGPDYESDRTGDARGPSFFAMGPKIGAYVGLDFKKPNDKFNFGLGLSPYAAPLFGINDENDHRGVVVGGSLDGLFRFSTK